MHSSLTTEPYSDSRPLLFRREPPVQTNCTKKNTSQMHLWWETPRLHRLQFGNRSALGGPGPNPERTALGDAGAVELNNERTALGDAGAVELNNERTALGDAGAAELNNDDVRALRSSSGVKRKLMISEVLIS